LDFRILGPLEVIGDDGPLDLGGARQHVVLAALLLSPNRVVPLERLVEALYGGRPPATSRSQAQIAISALRRSLADHGAGTAIVTRAQSYVIQVDGAQLDSQRFRELVAAARDARDAGQPDRAVASYREALRLWRGNALTGIDSDYIRLAAGHLDEQRVVCAEDRILLELELGRHHEMVGELTELVAQHPLREQLREQLMLALYRCGRTADALQAYRDTRQVLVDELGIEPGERLRRLEHAILVADPALELASAELASDPRQVVRPPHRTVTHMLPADIADFTGRAKQVEEIHHHLLVVDGIEPRLAVPIIAISGKGGAGKTSIAVHAAHGLSAHFPDGQLFTDLHVGSEPVSPMKVIDRFLRALGLAGAQIPETLQERAEAYRGLLADRKILVVLDNAATEAQVTPLLPGNPAQAVIVTSRGKMAGLAGAMHVDVDVFDAEKSVELLTRIAGSDRVASQPDAAAEIAALCGHLPLALRIAGARLSARQHWSVRQLVDRLSDETRRLDELRYGDMAIRASISLSYEGINDQARRLLRRLAILEVPAFSDWVPAALLDESSARAEDLLDELVSARLIETTTVAAHGQYRLHDLIRLFGRERLAAEEPAAERHAALERVLDALLGLAQEAHRRHYGGDFVCLDIGTRRWKLPDHLMVRLADDPLAWFDRERAMLLSAIRQAAEAGLAGLCWKLALSSVTLYESRFYLDDWRETHEIALEAAQRARDERGEAAMHYSIGTLCMVEQHFESAREHFGKAARMFEAIADDQGVALVIRLIAFLDRMSGRLDDSVRNYERALSLFRAGGDQVAAAYVLQSLAEVGLARGEADAAQGLLAEALRLSQSVGSSRVEAQVLYRMGEARLLTGDPELASEAFERALAKVQETRDLLGEAYALQGLGVARVRQGERAAGRRALDRAMALARSLSDRLIEGRILLGMSELALADGDPAQAVAHAEQAASIFRSTGTPLYEAQAMALLTRAKEAPGAPVSDTTVMWAE
jgi:DNA-binding SARP family transcriptional activator